jgi:hypothetical protein
MYHLPRIEINRVLFGLRRALSAESWVGLRLGGGEVPGTDSECSRGEGEPRSLAWSSAMWGIIGSSREASGYDARVE